ncbi:MAG: hypothetical protein AAGF83_23310 [Cyanobacteria bacterium P01_G01_bin.67]
MIAQVRSRKVVTLKSDRATVTVGRLLRLRVALYAIAKTIF